jgi:hypothetical protein
MFPLTYEPGAIGFCDFTRLKRAAITLRGEPFPHLLFHYRLATLGQIVHGGESFVALSEGLQNALATCSGVPKELLTDLLSAACRNRDGSYALDITYLFTGSAPRYTRRTARHIQDDGADPLAAGANPQKCGSTSQQKLGNQIRR